MPRSGGSLAARLAEVGGELTPSERRVAEEVLADPTQVAFDTVAALADRAGTSGPTVIRFAGKLGYDGFADLQTDVRRSVSADLARATDRIRATADATVRDRAAEAATRGVGSTLERLTQERLTALAAPLLDLDRRVWVLVGDSSTASGVVLTQGLGMLRPGVSRLSGSAVGMAPVFAEVDRRDTVVVVDFPRYERRLLQVADWLAADGLTIVGLTDGALSPIAALADVWAEIAVAAVGPFDSTLGSIAVAEALVAQVAHDLRDVATERLDRIEETWRRGDALRPLDGDRA